MSDQYIGEIRMFAGNYAPMDWAFCNGQILPIAQYSALFALLGTTYGGDGRTNFGLPNLQGRVPMHWGNGPGLTPRALGETAGAESVQLVASQMPAHNHTLSANGTPGVDPSPINNLPAVTVDAQSAPLAGYAESPTGTMRATAIGNTGGNQPHGNMQPYQCVSFIIALAGEFPPRS